MVVEPLAPATFFSTGIAGTHATPEVLQRFPATVMVAVFSVPGIGWQAWNAIQTQDLPLIMGTVLFPALLVTVSNFVVDLADTWLDPRVKYS